VTVQVITFEEDEGIDGLGSDPFVRVADILAIVLCELYKTFHREMTEFLLS